jgi:exopolysaccharide biosynthesis polyprenyl glycosylphosphotransferase
VPEEEAGQFALRQRQRVWVTHRKLIAASFLGDTLMVVLGLMAAWWLRFNTGLREVGVMHETLDFASYHGHFLLGSLLYLLLLVNFRLHDPRHFLSLRRTVGIILKCGVAWLVAYTAIALALKVDPSISRLYCVLACLSTTILLLTWRGAFHALVRDGTIARELRQKAVFIGWNSECTRALVRIQEGRGHPTEIIGIIAPPNGEFQCPPPADVPVLGNYHQRRRLLRDNGADIVLAVDGAISRDEMVHLSEVCGRDLIDFKLVPSCFQVLLSNLQLENINGMPVLGVGRLPLHHAFNHYLKRAVDIVGSLVGLALSAPVLAIFGFLVYRESPGPIFYRQIRIGQDGKPFWIYKLRSMRLDSEAAGSPGWTVANDPRRLRIGSFMRAWNIDELPQFWNVLRGDMSLVGPRPERPELIEGFKEQIPYYNVRHHVKPGITGWAQVNGLRGDTCLFERVKYDLHYMENWNLLLDFQIMAMTFYSRRGAC